jgi:hypothetical protein
MESRELIMRCRWGLRSGSRLGQNGNMTEGQGMVGDMTFRDSDRDVTRVGTWHDEDWGTKAWQDEGKDRDAGNY